MSARDKRKKEEGTESSQLAMAMNERKKEEGKRRRASGRSLTATIELFCNKDFRWKQNCV